MTTTAALPPTIQTAEPVRPRAAAVRADWNTADAFDAEKGTMGGYTQPASEDLTFSDLVDLINPLQHIPGVSQVYRALTGDTIKPAVKVMGGLVFGGPAGLMLGAGGALVDSMLGDPLAQVADAALGTNSARRPPATAVADATVPNPESAARALSDTAALQQVAALPTAISDPVESAPPQSVQPAPPQSVQSDVAPAPAAAAKVAGPADIGAVGEATLAALMAASQPRDLKGAAPPNRFDLAAYNGNAGAARPAGGKDIRTYFATAVPSAPAVRRPPVPAAAETTAELAPATSANPALAGNAVGEASASTSRPKPKAVGDAGPVAAEPARAAPQTNRQVPPWFADRVLQNLERYGGAGQPIRKPTEGEAASSG